MPSSSYVARRALVATAALAVIVLALTVFGSLWGGSDGGADELPALQPTGSETATGLLSVVVLLVAAAAVIGLVLAAAAYLGKRRADQARR